MWRLGLLMHAASQILFMLLGIVVVMFLLDKVATFVVGGWNALWQ